MHAVGESQLVPLEIWEVNIDDLKGRTASSAVDFLAASPDCYVRGDEAENLTTDDVILSTGVGGETVVPLRLSPRTQRKDETWQRQGVIVDRPQVASLLVRRKAELRPGRKVIGVSASQVRDLLAFVDE